MRSWTRRNWLVGAASGVAASLAAPWVRAEAAKPHVVVVGGGWGGLGAVRALAESQAVRITLIEAHQAFFSCPMSVSYLVGQAPFERFRLTYRRLEALGVQRIQAQVQAIARELRAVLLTDNRAVRYDYLVLAPGLIYDWQGIPGLQGFEEQFPVAFRPFEHTQLKAKWEQFLASGKGVWVISIPKPPYRCPPAPYERAAMFAEALLRRNIQGKIVILDANPHPMPQPIAEPILNTFAARYQGLIEYYPKQEAIEVDGIRREVRAPAGVIRFDGANFIPPMMAPDLVRQAGLGARFAEVQLPSFRSSRDERIFIVGDAIATPLPKSGHVAFGAGQQAAFHILAEINQTPKTYALGDTAQLPAGICWAKMGARSAIGIHVTASMVVGEAPKLQFQVDREPNAQSYQGSWDWARQQWRAMLG